MVMVMVMLLAQERGVRRAGEASYGMGMGMGLGWLEVGV